jgi:hypothetical protein
MNTIERLKSYLKYEGIREGNFCKSISASNGYVNSIYKGIGSDKRDLIIEKYPDLNMDWLLTGRGEMTLPDSNPILDDEKISRNQNSLRDKYILLLEQTVANLEAKIKELISEE